MADVEVLDPVPPPSVPTRAVVLSIVALWALYCALITLRGLVTDTGYFWEMLGRRALVSAVGVVVTLAAWAVLRRIEAQPLGRRILAAFLVMLPAALLLAVANQIAFASIERRLMEDLGKDSDVIKIGRDTSGNVLIEVPDAPTPPALPTLPPGVDVKLPPIPPIPVTSSGRHDQVSSVHDKMQQEGFLHQVTDIAVSRYFLLLAWAAFYLALGNAERVRAVERQAGEYRRAAKAAELRSLRYQVNPHFLFNTLNSLSALILTGRNERAEAMIHSLSSFYRRSLAPDPTEDVRLADEAALQQLYLEIEAQRFPDRLRSVFVMPDALADVCVPGMILQPLVENSVKYAVSATSEPVTIRVEAALEGDGRLKLTVSDDGPGGATSSGHGIGLRNVRDRLEARFGDAASFAAGPRADRGFEAAMTFPAVRHGC